MVATLARLYQRSPSAWSWYRFNQTVIRPRYTGKDWQMDRSSRKPTQPDAERCNPVGHFGVPDPLRYVVFSSAAIRSLRAPSVDRSDRCRAEFFQFAFQLASVRLYRGLDLRFGRRCGWRHGRE